MLFVVAVLGVDGRDRVGRLIGEVTGRRRRRRCLW